MNNSSDTLHAVFDQAFAGIRRTLATYTPQLTPREVGTVTSVSVGIAKVSGLPGVGFDELVKFPGDLYGIAFNVDEDEIGVVLLGDCEHLHAGAEVERTGRVMDVPVGDGLIGRVIDPLGGPLDGKGPVSSNQRLPIERQARPIMDRAPVTVPLQTGVIVIDALIPIGRGQRELILGDRQKLMQQQALVLADLHRRKDEFLAMLGHELRNPLAPITNAVQLLRLQKDNGKVQNQACAIIERQVGQLTRLVDDLLEVSRITTGKIRLQQERIALNGILERAVETTRPLVDQRGHELTVSLSPHTIWLFADAARLEQVIVNLLTNAAKYTADGGQISLAVQQEGEEAVLRVRDTGVGIAPELLPHIFDLFTQAERSLDRSQGGLGIGLCLVQRLVEMHGGKVEVHSALGKGSEFVVRLPILGMPATPPPLTIKDSAEPTGPSLRVLVVDDNVDAAQSLALLLETSGHDVRTAYDGRTALEVALDYRPNVVLLDIGLPGIDGFEVATQLRQQPGMSGVVLVALTGYGQAKDIEHSRNAGFDHHLVKPANLAKVLQILATVPDKAIGRRAEPREGPG